MSTFAVDASGQRALTSTINDPKRTHAQVTALAGDHANIQFGGFDEVRVVIPTNARLERRRATNGSEYLVLIAPQSLSVYGRASDTGVPHGWLYVGKHLEDFTDSLELVEVVQAKMGDLIPPTETE